MTIEQTIALEETKKLGLENENRIYIRMEKLDQNKYERWARPGWHFQNTS